MVQSQFELDLQPRLCGPNHGHTQDCVPSFDDLQPIHRSFLTERVGRLGDEELDEVCRALRSLADG